MNIWTAPPSAVPPHQADWDAFKSSEAFTQNLTPTDLQGWSHDSAIVGTRG